MNRIELVKHNLLDFVINLSKGNPGSIAAMEQILLHADKIDRDSAYGEIHSLLLLDKFKIYGLGIHILFKDKCEEDVRRLIILLRATEFGFVGVDSLQNMAADRMYQYDLAEHQWKSLDERVCARLPGFKLPTEKGNEEA